MLNLEMLNKVFKGKIENLEDGRYRVTFFNNKREYIYGKSSLEDLVSRLGLEEAIAREDMEYRKKLISKYSKILTSIEEGMERRQIRINNCEIDWIDCFRSANADSKFAREIKDKLNYLNSIGNTYTAKVVENVTIKGEDLNSYILEEYCGEDIDYTGWTLTIQGKIEYSDEGGCIRDNETIYILENKELKVRLTKKPYENFKGKGSRKYKDYSDFLYGIVNTTIIKEYPNANLLDKYAKEEFKVF